MVLEIIYNILRNEGFLQILGWLLAISIPLGALVFYRNGSALIRGTLITAVFLLLQQISVSYYLNAENIVHEETTVSMLITFINAVVFGTGLFIGYMTTILATRRVKNGSRN